MKKEKKTKKLGLTAIVIFLVGLLVAIQLIITHTLATNGEKLRKLELECREVERADSVLNEEINKIGSLSRINEEAEKLGLVKASQVMHLTSQVPVALSNSEVSLGH